MSGSKTITGIVLSNSTLAANTPAGSEVGTITVTMGDGTSFTGTLTLSGAYASAFSITAIRDPYTISAIGLDNASLLSNPAVGTKVGTISVTLSDGGVFAGTLAVDDTAHFKISGSDLVTSAALTNGANYNITITATEQGASNHALSAQFQISVQAAPQVPGPLTNIASPAQSSSTIDVTWAAPNTGGVCDNGVHQIQYKANSSSTWLNASPIPYCTPSHGSIVDATGATWTVNAQGHPVINATVTDTASTVTILYLINGLIWQTSTDGTWWSTPGGTSPAWTNGGTTSPLKLTISGLAASTTYNVRGYASNSAGSGAASAPINASTSATSTTNAPPQAAAVGYTVQTAGPTVTLGTNLFGPGANVRQNADGSITDLGSQPNGYNAHITPCIGGSTISQGVAFGGGGYFETVFSWANPPTYGITDGTDPNRGWPAFWSTTAEHDFTGYGDLPNQQNLELDTYEAMNTGNNLDYNCGIIHWFDGGGNDFTSNNANAGNPGIDGGTLLPAGTDVTQPMKIGFLWVPATATTQGYVETYFNNVRSKRYTWSQYTGGNFPTDVGDPPFSVMDIGRRRMWWGSGTKNPLTIYSFSVWQKDDSKNIRVGVPLPGGGGTTGGPGPVATSPFLTIDFASQFNNPRGTGQQVVSQQMYGVGSSSLVNNNFAAFADATTRSNLATVNPSLYMLKNGGFGYWNNDLSVNTATLANLINNFPAVDPLGVAQVWLAVDFSMVPNTSPQNYATAMANLARYLNGVTMSNGKKFPLFGLSGEDEPEGRMNEDTVASYYATAVPAVKAVNSNILFGGPSGSFMVWTDFGTRIPQLDFFVYNCFNEGSQSGGFPIAWDDFTTGVVNMLPRYASDAVNASAATGSNLKYMAMAGFGMDWDAAVAAQNSHVGANFAASVYITCLNNAPRPYLPCFWGGWGNGTAGIITDPVNQANAFYGVTNTMQITPKGYMMRQGVRTVYGPRVQVPTNRDGLLVLATKPTSTRLGVMVVNNSGISRSGQVALSNWPVNSSGNGTVNVWQMTSSTSPLPGRDGTNASVNVTNGLTAAMTFPGPSVTILST